MKAQIDEWLREGVICPSKSPWSSPLTPVKRKDGRTRWCVDYRVMNSYIIRDFYPLPTMEEILSAIRDKARIFSMLDASQVYLDMTLDEESMEITAFSTQFGVFEFSQMLFYVDDTLASTQMVMLCRIFQSYWDHSLLINTKKIKLFCSYKDFLSFNLLEKGLLPMEEGTEWIMNWPCP